MGGPCSLRLYGSGRDELKFIADQAIAEVLRLEQKYSRYRSDSVTATINKSAQTGEMLRLDEETSALLDYADSAYQQSDGLFDITSGVLRRVWDFKSQRVPTQQQIDQVLHQVGWDKVDWKNPRLKFTVPEMEIDFGGFVKEYAADRAAQVCRQLGVKHGLVELGGDLCVVGSQPGDQPWKIGIRHPRDPERPMALVDLYQGGLASSGDYERFMVLDGRRYHHILNPKTGWPVSGLASVTTIAEQCLVAGTATTIAMLKQAEGVSWLAELGLPYLVMDNELRISGTLTTVGQEL